MSEKKTVRLVKEVWLENPEFGHEAPPCWVSGGEATEQDLKENPIIERLIAQGRAAGFAMAWTSEKIPDDKRMRKLGWVKADKIRELREELASLEHEQWMAWSTELVKNEKLSQDRIERWKKYWVPYNDLSEKEKQFDRCWVDKLLEKILGSGKHKEKVVKG